ncbi:MAG: DUF5050 domain-containing protein [Oscillospiraceae bacterium]|nr:DUF5050 domain-containing protein [Oscillospiraceae bacterium]
MPQNKRRYYVVIPSILFLALAGLVSFLIIYQHSDKIDRVRKSSATEYTLSATPSKQGWIYYSNGNSVRKVKPNGSEDQKFTDFYSDFLFTVDDWVYYLDYTHNPEFPMKHVDMYNEPVLYIIKEDRTQKTQLCNIPVNYIDERSIICSDGWIYFSPAESYGRGLYRVKTDGSQLHKLTDEYVSRFDISDGKIYLLSGGLIGGINRINLDGSNFESVTDDIAHSLKVHDGFVYYTAEKHVLCRIKSDRSAEKELLTDFYIKDFFVGENYIYCLLIDDLTVPIYDQRAYLYRMNFDGTNLQKLSKKEAGNYFWYDDLYLYFRLVERDERYDGDFYYPGVTNPYKIRYRN